MSFDFLIEMAWKSALIGAATLLLSALLGRRSAGERSAVLRTGLAAILLLPLISFLLPALPVVTRTVYESASPLPIADLPMVGALPTPEPGIWDDPTPLVELAWLGGVMMVLLRLGVGLATLARWTRNGSRVACPEWRAAFARALARSDIRRPVRLLVSDAPAPMSWGWLRPVILLDGDTVRDASEADAVLAHELAHVVRRDWLTLMLARLVVALFWFNPLMWLLERRLVAEAEEASDARAIEHVEPGLYAQTLLSCAQQYGALTVPAAGIADTGLARRVKAILEHKLRVGAPDPRLIRLVILVCAMVAVPIAALKPVEAVIRVGDAAPAPEMLSTPEAPAVPGTPATLAALAAPATPGTPAAAPAAPTAVAAWAGVQPPNPPSPPVVAPAAPNPPQPPVPPRAPRAPSVGDAIWTDEDSREIEESVREAMAESAEARREALAEAKQAREEAMREVARSRDDIRRATELARVEMRRGMAEGAAGMEEGAREMERSAVQMEKEADKFRSESYRNEQIARSAREGRIVTHEQLLAMIPRMHEGAERMRRGADKMRAGAARMRSGQHD